MTYYAVNKGITPGVYDTWIKAEEQVKGYPGAIFKGFPTRVEAEAHFQAHFQSYTSIQVPDKTHLDTLTEEQRSVVDYLLTGRNVFLTGGGGVGKSYLLSVIYTDLPGFAQVIKTHYRIQICALTGCAALLLGHKAKTVHSWAGIGLGKGTVAELCVKIKRNKKALRNWISTDLLIIDEVSMMTAELVDKLNEIGQKLRGSKKPFGGIQLLLVGDFFQLPPVNKGADGAVFAFESAAWANLELAHIELTQIQRQKDAVFQTVLKEARIGALSKESCTILRGREGLDWKDNKIKPTLLFPKRAEVEMINDSNLKALQGKTYTYKAHLKYDGKVPKGFTENDEHFQQALSYMDANASYALELELVQNAQVMLIANVEPDAGLVNGSRGIIVGFCAATDLPIVEFINGVRKPVGTHAWPIEDMEFVNRTQIPLRLAFACTTHKAQGASLDSILVDIGSGNFEYGQAYVALSRARSLDALYVYDFDPIAFKAHPKVKDFYRTMVVSQMSEEEKQQIRASFVVKVDADVKPVLTEPLKPIQGITVVKEDVHDAHDAHDVIPGEVAITEIIIPGEPVNWLYESVPPLWKEIVQPCQEKLLELSTVLSTRAYLPKQEEIWTALALTAPSAVRVVILGQDPYPTPGNAHGLAFSVQPPIRPLPASLKNIYKELATDIGLVPAEHGNLVSWAQRGVLLLNTVLTVEAGQPQSHSKIGWEEVTDQVIRSIAARSKNVVFVLWGKSAQVKKKLLAMFLEMNQHKVIESAHPSPLSASKGFFGSKPFSQVNALLESMGQEPVDWSI